VPSELSTNPAVPAHRDRRRRDHVQGSGLADPSWPAPLLGLALVWPGPDATPGAANRPAGMSCAGHIPFTCRPSRRCSALPT